MQIYRFLREQKNYWPFNLCNLVITLLLPLDVSESFDYFCIGINNKKDSVFTKVLQGWYEIYGRDLPWRATKNPYLIWISEVILQQTRVAQGYDYYLRFKERFPSVACLAEADEDEVLKYWQGLGYYSRARNLHEAARSIKGEFPKTYAEVRALKGVGDYTAAAICSFAYNMPYAVVDGNVYRVLSRYFGLDYPIDKSKGKKEFASLAQELLDKEHPARYNQAIMDFGALQCTPKQPKCESCPLRDSCIAFSQDRTDELPVKEGKVRVKKRYFNFFYIEQGECTYLEKRVERDIWKNLFQLPLVETEEMLTLNQLIQNKSVQELFKNVSHPTFTLEVKDYKHVLSHQHLHSSLYRVVVGKNSSLSSEYLKIGRDEIDQYAIPRLIHLFVEKIRENS